MTSHTHHGFTWVVCSGKWRSGAVAPTGGTRICTGNQSCSLSTTLQVLHAMSDMLKQLYAQPEAKRKELCQAEAKRKVLQDEMSDAVYAVHEAAANLENHNREMESIRDEVKSIRDDIKSLTDRSSSLSCPCPGSGVLCVHLPRHPGLYPVIVGLCSWHDACWHLCYLKSLFGIPPATPVMGQSLSSCTKKPSQIDTRRPFGAVLDRFFGKVPPKWYGAGAKCGIREWNCMERHGDGGVLDGYVAAAAFWMSVRHLSAPRTSMPGASAGVLYAMPACGLMEWRCSIAMRNIRECSLFMPRHTI